MTTHTATIHTATNHTPTDHTTAATTSTATGPTGADASPVGPTQVFHPDPAKVRRAVERRSVANLATVSGAGRPHVATVLYQCVDDALYVSTDLTSRKARNVAATGGAAVTIPVRRLPVGPPASIQFQASSANVLANDDPEILRLASEGRLDNITGHDELNREGACFLRIKFPERVVTYALGMSLWHVIRHPLDSAGEAHLHTSRPAHDRN